MEWCGRGIFLTSRPFGESSVIIEVFTGEHGLYRGVVRGGATSRRLRPILQTGAELDLTWRARLEDHLGAFTVEPIRSRSATILMNRFALTGANAITALLVTCLPERMACPRLYARTEALFDLLDQPDLWPLAYVQWEMLLLDELGFGLDLSQCAATDARDAELTYISPRTGRAVSKAGAGEWADRLLPLPGCLTGQGDGTPADILQGLQVTGHFLHRYLTHEMRKENLPPARGHLIKTL